MHHFTFIKQFLFLQQDMAIFRGESRTAATSKMEHFVITINYYHKKFHLGCCSSPRSAQPDFNCHHTTWDYSRNNHDREALHDWSNTIDLKLLYNYNQPKTFYSAAWDTYTNPDLTFFTHDTDSSLPHPEHSVLGNFPKSQHRPTIIYHPTLIEYTPTSSLPRWDFSKADWERFHAATRSMCDDLPSPESDINLCYAAFQKKLLKIAKDIIPRGFRKNCIPKWDARCNELASQHKKAQSVEEKLLSANRLIDPLNSKRKEQWISTVESIDMK